MSLLKLTNLLKKNCCFYKIPTLSRNYKRNMKSCEQIFLKNNVGSEIEGYKLEKITSIQELNLTVGEFLHKNTGAKHIHIAADDSNNAFSVSFKTPVNDDTGVAHILEHMVLCGSKNYPVRDPFFKMSLRSVSTFMNAMTFPDHTTYPFSSVNKKDFSNLMSIYLDCVFNPLLKYEDFKQEAWRLEKNDKLIDSIPIIQGVVFNEMKGVFNSQNSIQDLEFTKRLLPISYSNNYGGNPLNIVDLKYEQLKSFYHKYYTPQNSLFITYGNTPVEEHLKLINKILDNCNKNTNMNVILPLEKTWKQNKNESSTIPYDPLLPQDKQSIYTKGFKLDIDESEYSQNMFLMAILSKLLLDGPNSPFYKFLLAKNLGSDYCGQTGLSNYTKSHTFGIGLKGVNYQDIDKIEENINNVFNYVKENGFEKNHILGAIKETELSLKHISSKTGINYVIGLPTKWAHDYEIVQALQVKKHIDYIMDNYENGLFEETVKKQFIENKHVLNLSLHPDKDFLKKINEKEKLLVLKLIKENELTSKNVQNIKESEDYVDKILPKVTLKDLNDKIPEYIAEHNVIGEEIPLQTSIQPTNGLSYVRININANSVPLLLRPYIPLFCHILTQIGASKMSHEKIAEEISLNSSPFDASPLIRTDLNNINNFDKNIILSSYCPDKNVEKMMSIWIDLFNEPWIKNDEHLRVLISEYIDNMLSSIPDNAHRYAMIRACSHLSKSSEYCELLNGLSQIEFSKHLSTLLTSKSDLDKIIQNIISLASYLLDQSKLSCLIICEQHFISKFTQIMNDFICQIPTSLSEPCPISTNTNTNLKTFNINKEFIYMPFRVNYNAASFRIPPFLHDDYSKYFNFNFYIE